VLSSILADDSTVMPANSELPDLAHLREAFEDASHPKDMTFEPVPFGKIIPGLEHMIEDDEVHKAHKKHSKHFDVRHEHRQKEHKEVDEKATEHRRNMNHPIVTDHVNEHFRDFDHDLSNHITYNEFKKHFTVQGIHGPMVLPHAKREFELFDSDGSGHLSPAEFKEHMHDHHIEDHEHFHKEIHGPVHGPTKTAVYLEHKKTEKSKKLHEKHDKNGDGKVHLQEFVQTDEGMITHEKTEQHLTTAFKLLDQDRDGELSVEELHMGHWLETVGLHGLNHNHDDTEL